MKNNATIPKKEWLRRRNGLRKEKSRLENHQESISRPDKVREKQQQNQPKKGDKEELENTNKPRLVNGIPQNTVTVKRFLTKSELDDLRKNGFTFDPNDTRGGLSTTSKKVNPVDGDGLKESTGALDADH